MNNEPIPPEVHAAARLALFDICECGDYRREHRGAGGRCIMADDLCHRPEDLNPRAAASKRAAAIHQFTELIDWAAEGPGRAAIPFYEVAAKTVDMLIDAMLEAHDWEGGGGCAGCGCTEENACEDADGHPCGWSAVENDRGEFFCTACVDPAVKHIVG